MKRRVLASAARLRDDARGAATIEFALWSALFFLAIMPALDFGTFYLERARLGKAVATASIHAFMTADDPALEEIPAHVRSIGGVPAALVTIGCNGVAASCASDNRDCACLRADGSYLAATCGSSCRGVGMTADSTAGRYLTIRAEQSFHPLVLPGGAPLPAMIVEEATVRLQ